MMSEKKNTLGKAVAVAAGVGAAMAKAGLVGARAVLVLDVAAAVAVDGTSAATDTGAGTGVLIAAGVCAKASDLAICKAIRSSSFAGFLAAGFAAGFMACTSVANWFCRAICSWRAASCFSRLAAAIRAACAVSRRSWRACSAAASFACFSASSFCALVSGRVLLEAVAIWFLRLLRDVRISLSSLRDLLDFCLDALFTLGAASFALRRADVFSPTSLSFVFFLSAVLFGCALAAVAAFLAGAFLDQAVHGKPDKPAMLAAMSKERIFLRELSMEEACDEISFGAVNIVLALRANISTSLALIENSAISNTWDLCLI